jgi:hypothetical protein
VDDSLLLVERLSIAKAMKASGYTGGAALGAYLTNRDGAKAAAQRYRGKRELTRGFEREVG